MRSDLELKGPRNAAALVAICNAFLLLYIMAWIAGVHGLRQLSDWRGPLAAFLLAILLTAFAIIQQIQAIG